MKGSLGLTGQSFLIYLGQDVIYTLIILNNTTAFKSLKTSCFQYVKSTEEIKQSFKEISFLSSLKRTSNLGVWYFPTGTFPRTTSQLVTSQMCDFPSGNFPKVYRLGPLRLRWLQWGLSAAARMGQETERARTC